MSAPEAILRPAATQSWASRQRLTLWVASPFGLPTGLHASFPIAFLLLTFALGDEVLPEVLRGTSPIAHFALGAAATLILFLSVLAHELGHGLAARQLGMTVDGVVLFAFGGLIAIEKGPNSPRDEAIVTAAGPFSSVLIAVLSAAGFALAQRSAPLAVTLLLAFLALTNGLLSAFNLLPSLPLDGGRLLHALLWRLLGSASAASRWAGGMGVVFGLLIVLFGLRQGLGGAPVEAFWCVVTGAYLGWGAFSELRPLRSRAAKEGRARQVQPEKPRAPTPLPLEEEESERAA